MNAGKSKLRVRLADTSLSNASAAAPTTTEWHGRQIPKVQSLNRTPQCARTVRPRCDACTHAGSPQTTVLKKKGYSTRPTIVFGAFSLCNCKQPLVSEARGRRSGRSCRGVPLASALCLPSEEPAGAIRLSRDGEAHATPPPIRSPPSRPLPSVTVRAARRHTAAPVLLLRAISARAVLARDAYALCSGEREAAEE